MTGGLLLAHLKRTDCRKLIEKKKFRARNEPGVKILPTKQKKGSGMVPHPKDFKSKKRNTQL